MFYALREGVWGDSNQAYDARNERSTKKTGRFRGGVKDAQDSVMQQNCSGSREVIAMQTEGKKNSHIRKSLRKPRGLGWQKQKKFPLEVEVECSGETEALVQGRLGARSFLP